MEVFCLVISLCPEYYIFKEYVVIYDLVIIIEVVVKHI
jgi:hypothetical protein